MAGLDGSSELRKLEEALSAKYGAKIAEQIASGNALRVLHELWP